jgi:hypothetical protein
MKTRYKTRDPEPMSRDPEPENAPPTPPPVDHALRMDVEPVRCQRCGGTAFNNCHATRPSRAADKMTRRKQCMRCGQWWVQYSEPTDKERAKFW